MLNCGQGARRVDLEGRANGVAGVHNVLFVPTDDSDGIWSGQRSRCSPETVGTGEIGGRGRFLFLQNGTFARSAAVVLIADSSLP